MCEEEQWRNSLAEAQREVARLQSILSAVLGSRSWKLTAPLRTWAMVSRQSALDRMVKKHSKTSKRNSPTNVRVRSVPLSSGTVTPSSEQVCAVVHVYYPELLPEIVKYLSNCRELRHVILTYDNSLSREVIQFALEPLEVRAITFELLPVNNKGRDVAPFLYVVDKALETECKVFIKLHTKKSPHLIGREGEMWRQRLLSGLLPNSESCSAIISEIANDRHFGFATPANCAAGRESWGRNRRTVRQVLKPLGIKPTRDLIFPAGNMFWFSRSLLARIAQLQVDINDFPEENGQLDATLAHAIERAIYFLSSGQTIWLIDGATSSR
jgi:lipopolysaccharide biosynthesis protein